MPYVNIAYTVVDDYIISEIEDVNETKKPEKEDIDDNDISDNFWNNATSLPATFIIGGLISMGVMTGVLIGIFIIHKKKNNPPLSPSKKRK